MIKNTLSFGLKLLILLLIVFGIHVLINYNTLALWSDHLIIESYLTNYLLVLISYLIILFFKERKSDNLGFIFIGGSILKFAIYMLFFNPSYKADGIVIPAEYSSFLVPYIIALVYETSLLVRILNRS